MRVHPVVAPHVPFIVDSIVEIMGDNLGKVVLLGSAIRQDFDPLTSDVDIAVLAEAPVGRLIMMPMLHLADEMSICFDIKVSFAVRSREEIERWSAFDLCWEGQVSRGITLIEAEHLQKFQQLAREEAKAEVIAHYQSQADAWLKNAESFQTAEYRQLAVWEAGRAACRSLQAFLLFHEIDPSPKPSRWNVTSLFKMATSADDEMNSLHKEISSQNEKVTLQEKIDVLSDEEPVPSLRRVRGSITGARRIVAECKRRIYK